MIAAHTVGSDAADRAFELAQRAIGMLQYPARELSVGAGTRVLLALHLKQECVTPERYQKIADLLLDSTVHAAWRMEYPFVDKRQGGERFGKFFRPICSLQHHYIIAARGEPTSEGPAPSGAR